jgi:hypothetical protein
MFNDTSLYELSRSTGFPTCVLLEFAECGLLPSFRGDLDGMGLLRNLLEVSSDE